MESKLPTNTGMSYMNDFIAKAATDLIRKRDEQLAIYIRTNLASDGFTFETDEEFNAFAKERLHAIHLPFEKCEIYLDYNDVAGTGKLIGVYSKEVNIKWDDNDPFKLTATIG